MCKFEEIGIYFFREESFSVESQSLSSLLDTLDDAELVQLKKFLDSPFFCNNQEIRLLFKLLKKYRKDGNTDVRGEILIDHIWPGIDTDLGIKKLRSRLSRLEKLTEKFISHHELKQDEILQSKILTSTLKKRNNNFLFKKAASEYLRRLLLQKPTIMKYFDQWWVNHQLHFHQQTEQGRPNAIHLFEGDVNLEKFFLLVKLRYYCEFQNRKNILSDNFEILLPESALHGQCSEPLISLYRQIIPLIECKQFDEAEFDDFLQELAKYKGELTPADLLSLTKFAFNIITRAIRCGNEKAIGNFQKLTQIASILDLYTFERKMADSEYLNLVVMAGMASDFKLQKEFIEQGKEFIEPEKREIAYQLATAYYYFHQNQFENSIEILERPFPKYTQNEVKYMIRVKALLVRIHLGKYLADWEGYDEEIFKDAAENLRKFIERQLEKGKIKNEHTIAYKSMIELCKLLYQQKKALPNAVEKIETIRNRLLEELNEKKVIIGKSWFRKKIEELC